MTKGRELLLAVGGGWSAMAFCSATWRGWQESQTRGLRALAVVDGSGAAFVSAGDDKDVCAQVTKVQPLGIGVDGAADGLFIDVEDVRAMSRVFAPDERLHFPRAMAVMGGPQ